MANSPELMATSGAALPRARIPAPPAVRPAAHRNGRLTERGWRVLDELEALFFDQGFVDFTLGDLAARLRCSRRTLYEIAPSKEELVLVVIDRVLQRTGRRAHDAAGLERTKIGQLYAFLHAVAVGFGHASLAFSRDIESVPAATRLVDTHTAYGVSVLEALIERAIAEGEFKPVHARLVAEILMAGLQRVQDPRLLEATHLTLADGVEDLARVVTEGLRA